MNKSLQTKAWLLKGVYSLSGQLKLSNDRLSFTAFNSGNFWPKKLRKLETVSHCTGLAKQLENGEKVVLFDVPLAEISKINFPWYYFSGGFKITVNGVRYRFGFDKPANTKMADEGGDLAGEISKARQNGKKWRAVLGKQFK